MKKTFFIVVLLILSYVGFSQTIPENKGYVTDYENLFTPEQNAQLTKILTDYEQKTSIEIAVLTVKDFESDIADFAQKTATKWGLGKKGVDNGLLIIISKNKKVFRSETGYGLEGYLPDGWLKLQGDSIVKSYFKNDIVVSSKEDTSVVNKTKDFLNTSQNWLNQNVTDTELRKVLKDVNVLDDVGIVEKSSVSSDTNTNYFDGLKAFIFACESRIDKEGYSADHNKELLKTNNKDESIISYLFRIVPWWGWCLIVVIWFVIFLLSPELAIQLLFLGFAGKGGGSGGGGFGGGKFGGGGADSNW
jgi:hypothetical protein